MTMNDTGGNEKLKDLFGCFDRDGDGCIYMDEWKNTMHILNNCGMQISEEELEEWFVDACTDGKDTITQEEFIKMMIGRTAKSDK